MSKLRPLLFRGKTQDLLAEIDKELRDPATLGWQGQKGGAGRAMVGLFGRLADIIIARLNQVPQQHFLAFLSEGGIDQLPPRAAATRLRFVPENDARPAIPVPAGTQVATRPSGNQPEIIFETEHDVQVVPTELKWCIAVDQRTSADRSKQATGQEPGAFPAFQGEEVRQRILYLRDDTLLAFPDSVTRSNATVLLHFELDPAVQPAGEWQLIWAYFNGEDWTPLAGTTAQVADETGGLMRSGAVRFTRLPELAAAEVNGDKGIWLACRLVPAHEEITLPRILGITISREIVVPRQVVTPRALTATQAGVAFAQVKAEDAFYPFGQYPALLDGLYIRADEAFTKPGATIELQFEEDGLPAEMEDTSALEALTIVWEYFSAAGWTRLGVSRWGCPAMAFADIEDPLIKSISVHTRLAGRQVEVELPEDYEGAAPPSGFPSGTLDVIGDRPIFITDMPAVCADLPVQIVERGRCYAFERLDFRDETCAFTVTGAGVIAFTVPTATGADPSFAPVEVNGQIGYWVRARIVDGGFSVPQSSPSGLLQKLLFGKIPAPPPTAIPPLVRGFQVSYADYRSVEGPRPVQNCWGKTDGGWRSPVAGHGFAPFSASVEHEALYLGFLPLKLDPTPSRGEVTSPLHPAFPANTWIELHLSVEETGDERTQADVVWQYWNGQGWQALGVVDETLDLWRSGSVGFFAPPDHQLSIEFGQAAFWLRVCPASLAVPGQDSGTGEGDRNEAAPMPRLSAIHLNTVPGNNGESVNDEVLGSSSGEKNQVFGLSRPPVLPDAQIEVREVGEQAEASDHTWIRWDRVPSLLSCGPADRCYTLDPTSGMITFGNGVHGMIPPAGQDNIRARHYCTHSGQTGNVAASAITVLRNPKDALNEIRRVENVEPATGGAELEETAQVELRGPYSLKNRGRAITAEDFEWLAREIAGTRRIYCLPARTRDSASEPGWVTVVVVPAKTHTVPDSEGRPIPTPALLRQVREYLEARGLVNLARPAPGAAVAAAPFVDRDQIHVTGPGYVEVEVVARVVPVNPIQADNTRKDILKQLAAFLDPIDGGPGRQGWQSGRDVYISEIKAEIEGVPGVDHVQSAFLRTPSRQQQFLYPDPMTSVTWTVPAGSRVSTFDDRLRAVLAGRLPENTPLEYLAIIGFNTGDTAGLARLQDPALFVRRVSILHEDAAEVIFDLPIDFSDDAAFAQWRNELGETAALVSQDGHIREAITDYRTATDATGRVHLLGVRVDRFVAGESVSITDAEHGNRRIDFLPVNRVKAAERLFRVFVPADHLVFSGSHEIEMVLEEPYARQAT